LGSLNFGSSGSSGLASGGGSAFGSDNDGDSVFTGYNVQYKGLVSGQVIVEGAPRMSWSIEAFGKSSALRLDAGEVVLFLLEPVCH